MVLYGVIPPYKVPPADAKNVCSNPDEPELNVKIWAILWIVACRKLVKVNFK